MTRLIALLNFMSTQGLIAERNFYYQCRTCVRNLVGLEIFIKAVCKNSILFYFRPNIKPIPLSFDWTNLFLEFCKYRLNNNIELYFQNFEAGYGSSID